MADLTVCDTCSTTHRTNDLCCRTYNLIERAACVLPVKPNLHLHADEHACYSMSILVVHSKVACAGQVRIWDPSSGRCLHTLEGPDGGIEWLCWHPLGNIILAGSEDFSTWMWNAQTGIFMQVSTLAQCFMQNRALPAVQRLCQGVYLSNRDVQC